MISMICMIYMICIVICMVYGVYAVVCPMCGEIICCTLRVVGAVTC